MKDFSVPSLNNTTLKIDLGLNNCPLKIDCFHYNIKEYFYQSIYIFYYSTIRYTTVEYENPTLL